DDAVALAHAPEIVCVPIHWSFFFSLKVQPQTRRILAWRPSKSNAVIQEYGDGSQPAQRTGGNQGYKSLRVQ
ncbi:MAG: hypothetical protein AAB385_11815, partial [Planctomycetota bacterium]